MKSSGKAPLLAIFVTVFIDLLGFGIVLPLLPRYAEHFEASDLTLGLLMSSFSAMQFLFAPVWGRVSDRIGRRPVLLLGLAGSTASYALFAYVTSLGRYGSLAGLDVLTWLFITRIGAGIAGATIPTAQAFIADVTGPADRAKGMALIGAAFGIGFTFGPLLGAGFVSSVEGGPPSAAPGYVASVLSGLALIFAAVVLPESRSAGQAAAPGGWFSARFADAFRRSEIVGLFFTIFLTTFAFAQFESTLSLLTKDLGLSDRYNYLVFAYIGLVLTLSQGLLVRRLVPRVGEYRMALAGTLAMVVGLLLIGVAGGARSLPALYAVLPLCVIGFSAVTPSLHSLLSRRTSAEEQGRTLGMGQSAAALARILGPAVGMPLLGWQLTSPYWTGAALMFLGTLCVFTFGREPAAPAEGVPGA